MIIKSYKKSFVIIMILLLLPVLVFAIDSNKGFFSIDNSEYDVGEKVSISLYNNSIEESMLKIVSSRKIYNYMNPPEKVVFVPKTSGPHLIELYSYSTLLDNLIFNVNKGEADEEADEENVYLYLKKNSYELGEEVPINIDFVIAGEAYTLRIVAPEHEYQFMGIYKSPIVFMPKSAGIHEIILLDELDNVVQRLSFEVVDTSAPVPDVDAEVNDKPKLQAHNETSFKLKIRNSKNQLMDADIEVLWQGK